MHAPLFMQPDKEWSYGAEGLAARDVMYSSTATPRFIHVTARGSTRSVLQPDDEVGLVVAVLVALHFIVVDATAEARHVYLRRILDGCPDHGLQQERVLYFGNYSSPPFSAPFFLGTKSWLTGKVATELGEVAPLKCHSREKKLRRR